MAEDMESIPQRVNDLEKSSFSHEERIRKLETLPTKVSEHDARLAGIDVRLSHIEQSSSRIEAKQESIISKQQDLHNQVAMSVERHQTTSRNLGILLTVLTIASLAIGLMKG